MLEYLKSEKLRYRRPGACAKLRYRRRRETLKFRRARPALAPALNRDDARGAISEIRGVLLFRGACGGLLIYQSYS